ncbi:MAG: 2-octaprenylphenol hydroxylase [Oceanospirillaceae bacterium]|jgi:2-octaprenylphenol hydroxylase
MSQVEAAVFDANIFDVAIVGAGMVGASLACGLIDAGFKVALIESGELNPSQNWPAGQVDARVSALSLASENLLKNLAVWPIIENMARLQAYNAMNVWDACGTGQLNFTAAEQHLPYLGHIVENRTITSALHQTLGNKQYQLFERSQIVDMTAQGTVPRRLTLAGGEQISAALVVGADGANSKIRQLAGLPTREWDYPHHALVTRVKVTKPHQNTAWQRFTEDGILAFLPLQTATEEGPDSHYCSIVWSRPKAQAQLMQQLPESEFCIALTRAFEGKLGAVMATDQRHVIPLRQRHAKRYVQAGLVLVGDAAHTIHPLAGQGVNLGFLDVAALVETLKQAAQQGDDIASIRVLENYQAQRRGDNLRMMSLMESFSRLFGNQHPMLSLLRNTGMNWVQKLSPIKQHLAQQAMGVGVHLPPLSQAPQSVKNTL